MKLNILSHERAASGILHSVEMVGSKAHKMNDILTGGKLNSLISRDSKIDSISGFSSRYGIFNVLFV